MDRLSSDQRRVMAKQKRLKKKRKTGFFNDCIRLFSCCFSGCFCFYVCCNDQIEEYEMSGNKNKNKVNTRLSICGDNTSTGRQENPTTNPLKLSKLSNKQIIKSSKVEKKKGFLSKMKNLFKPKLNIDSKSKDKKVYKEITQLLDNKFHKPTVDTKKFNKFDLKTNIISDGIDNSDTYYNCGKKLNHKTVIEKTKKDSNTNYVNNEKFKQLNPRIQLKETIEKKNDIQENHLEKQMIKRNYCQSIGQYILNCLLIRFVLTSIQSLYNIQINTFQPLVTTLMTTFILVLVLIMQNIVSLLDN